MENEPQNTRLSCLHFSALYEYVYVFMYIHVHVLACVLNLLCVDIMSYTTQVVSHGACACVCAVILYVFYESISFMLIVCIYA